MMADFDETLEILHGTDNEVTKLEKSQLGLEDVEMASVMNHLSSTAHDLRLSSNTGNGLKWELPCKARLT